MPHIIIVTISCAADKSHAARYPATATMRSVRMFFDAHHRRPTPQSLHVRRRVYNVIIIIIIAKLSWKRVRNGYLPVIYCVR